MKKIVVLLLMASVAFVFTSCRKEGQTVTKIINVQLNENQSYSSQVPSGDADDVMQITSQAKHAAVSKLTVDPSTGSNLFQYTPVSNYAGADEVQISNTEGRHHGNGPTNGGQCGGGHHHDDLTIYI